jgi:hypothetical protein
VEGGREGYEVDMMGEDEESGSGEGVGEEVEGGGSVLSRILTLSLLSGSCAYTSLFSFSGASVRSVVCALSEFKLSNPSTVTGSPAVSNRSVAISSGGVVVTDSVVVSELNVVIIAVG